MKKSRLIVFGICVITILTMIVTLAPSIRNGMTLGLDLQGGFEILYEVSPLDGQDMPEMSSVVSSVRKRVDVLGVNEPEITVEGDNRIRVQLAGVDNPEQARRIISSTANLTFRDVNDNLLMDATVLEEGGASVARIAQIQVDHIVAILILRQRCAGTVWQLCGQPESERFEHILSGDFPGGRDGQRSEPDGRLAGL